MELTVVIVNYNVKFYIEQCLISLYRSLKGLEAEVYVVDNHSSDGSVEYLSERFPQVNFISSNHNLGFSRANNKAIRQSESDYVLLLNPDTIVGEHTISDVLDFMHRHPNAGGCGVRMLHSDGSNAMESRRGVPTPMTAFYKMCGLCSHYPKSKRFGRYYMSNLPWDQPERIEIISGAFCMLRRSALDKTGLLDEDFFMYGEDIDLSYRLLLAGYENWYFPTRILHYKGESTQKSSFRYVHVFYEAMLIFFKKHYGHASMFLSIPVKTAIYLKATIVLIKMQTEKIHKSLGFFRKRKTKDPFYIFICTEKSITQCKKIARKKGLEAVFHIADAHSYPKGHLDFNCPERERLCAVYDINAYSFEQILEIFGDNPQHHLEIGTYNPQTRTIITAEEILR